MDIFSHERFYGKNYFNLNSQGHCIRLLDQLTDSFEYKSKSAIATCAILFFSHRIYKDI